MAITVIGDALVDIIVPASDIERGDTHYRNISVSCGGTANVAIQVAGLGEDVKFMGRVGNDPLGLHFVDNLKQHRVSELVFSDNDSPTGLCVSLVYEDGERSMVASRGANDYWSKMEVDTCIDQIMESRFVYFSGYSLLNNLDVISYLMERCHEKTEVWFNPGAPNLDMDYFPEIIHDFVDGLILNLDEARSITNKDEIDEITGALGMMVALPVITLGKAGCVVVRDAEGIRVPVDCLVEDADTTGAGDAFSAGFMVGRLRGLDELQSAQLGHKVAAGFLQEKKGVV